MVPPHSPHDTNISYDDAPWDVIFILTGIDMAMMQKGLFWTTQNLVLLNGQQTSYKAVVEAQECNFPWKQDIVRVWQFREFPSRPIAESRWCGGVILHTQSTQTLDGFRLGKLKRQLICYASVKDNTGNEVFVFNPEEPGENRNDLFGSDSGTCDLWWLWPMESIIPEEPDECLTRPRTGSDPHPQVGGGKQERGSECHVNSGQALLSGSIRVVAWGIFVLLSAMGIVVLGFGLVIMIPALRVEVPV
ncbi:hypothetical protein B0H67DRAFT_646030 [Lasiosphaeris hirsuta]|uniref:Uncharacterized protein n=1 Tax=Lasiosphaeris hirsuta TaxID=260670 RepID=A0AA40A7E0_9PEZI|nr:hypothetical protein B0H67DRAFT_646030 [Lasiosphaeris hirsuta]